MKRTLKRESKVLEIVRREAIGAGGSLYVPRLFSGVCLLGEPQDWRVPHRASVLCLSRRKPCIQSGRRASIGFMSRVADGCWGLGPAGWPHGCVPPARPRHTCHRRGRGSK